MVSAYFRVKDLGNEEGKRVMVNAEERDVSDVLFVEYFFYEG